MIVQPSVAPFLDRSRPVELVTRHEGGGLLATERWELGPLPSYGTVVEAPLAEPRPGGPMRLDVSTFGPDALRLRFHRGVAPIAPLVLTADDQPIDPQAVATVTGVIIDDQPFAVRAGHDRLRTRPVELDALERLPAGGTAWPPHEQRWQVHHRFAYPVGTTADDDVPAWFATFALAHDERIFGLGEDFGPLCKNGTRHHLWMQEAFSNSSPAVYKPVPFWWSTAGYGVLVNTTHPVRVDVGAADHSALSVLVEGTDQLDLVVITGDSPADILATYCRLTATPRVPPAWSFGVWMGRISYRSQDEVEAVAQEMVDRDVPCDVLHLDTHWFEEEWNCDYHFSPTRFPDPAGMIRRLSARGIRVSLWQWPNVLTTASTYDECRSRGILATDPDTGEPALQEGFVGPAAVIDWSHPEAAAWIAERLRPLLELGVACIKTDFGEGAPPDARYHGFDGMAMHNAYPLLYNEAVMRVSAEVHGDEAVVWSRSGWAGSQRFPIHWSGDGVARWDDLACVVRSMLSVGLSGLPFYAHDIGGFSGVPNEELYVRWTQLGVCSSHLRFHGFPPREPWEFGDEVEHLVRDLLHLRKRIQPYLVEQARAARTGAPLCRAMVFAFPHDPTCTFLDDQYLLGDDLLVAPVVRPGGRRRLYVPEGEWLDWWSGDAVDGGWHEVHLPIERFPLLVRAGSTVAELSSRP